MPPLRSRHAHGSVPARAMGIGVVLAWAACMAMPAAGGEPWRLDDVIPGETFSLTVDQRTRYEHLSEQFRITQIDGPQDQVLVLRTLVHGRVQPLDGIRLGAEMQDSRAYVDEGTVLTTTVVNAVELLRAYAELEREDVMGGRLRLTGGLVTMDVGSRRFVARNRFRNTINGFLGADLEWTSGGRDQTVYRAFWTLPVDRLPKSQSALHDNEIELDRESVDRQFWGLFASSHTEGGLGLDTFFFGLHERDVDAFPLNRNLFTAGARLLRKPAAGHLDYAVEFALQWGESRFSSASTTDLDHFAHFEHLEAGFSFDAPWQPRVVLQWDYASGDKDPADDKNGRFDTLYGARRFDFGPTGIYGPFARSNLNTPGTRIQVRPTDDVSAFIGYRAFWLAQKKDRWTTTGVWDPTGQSGSFLGQQIEIRVRWNPLPGNIGLETGWAHMFRGEFAKTAPNEVTTRDSDYVYTQVTLRL